MEYEPYYKWTHVYTREKCWQWRIQLWPDLLHMRCKTNSLHLEMSPLNLMEVDASVSVGMKISREIQFCHFNISFASLEWFLLTQSSFVVAFDTTSHFLRKFYGTLRPHYVRCCKSWSLWNRLSVTSCKSQAKFNKLLLLTSLRSRWSLWGALVGKAFVVFRTDSKK